MTIGLRECPFCGGRADIVRLSVGFYVECKNDNCKANMCPFGTPEEAAAAWNERKLEKEWKAALDDIERKINEANTVLGI